MKILFIIPEEFKGERWGGVTTYTVELAKELRKRGHDISILTPGLKTETVRVNGVTVYKTPTKRPRALSALLVSVFRVIGDDVSHRLLWAYTVKDFIRSRGPFDCIEAPEWGSSTLLLDRRPSQKIIVRLHKSWLMYVKDNQLPVSIGTRVVDILERWCILTASVVTSPTKFMLSQYPFLVWLLRVMRCPALVVPNGVELSSVRGRVRSPAYKPYILSVGRIEIAKGSVLLGDAFVRVAGRYTNLHLVYVGEDTKMFIKGKWMSCKRYIQNTLPSRTRNFVHFVGRQSHRTLGRYYQNCLFYVASSCGHENPSMSLLEALSFGKAAVGSNAGGIPEVLHNHGNGLLFHEGVGKDLEDKIRLMLDAKVRRRCERISRSDRSVYDVRDTARQTLRVYAAK